MKELIRKFWMWVWKKEWIPLGKLAPYVLGLALGSKPRKVKKGEPMPKNSLYDGQEINVSEPGEQSPPDNIECPESCEYCPPSRSYEDCLYTTDCPTSLPECIYNDLGKETAGDMEYHELVDEGKLDEFGRRKGEG